MKTLKKVWEVIRSNCCLTVYEVEEAGISKPDVVGFSLKMWACSVLHLLSEDEKQTCVDISKKSLLTLKMIMKIC